MFLIIVSVIVINGSCSLQFLLVLFTDGSEMELATKDVYCKMRKLVGTFVSQDVCLTLSDLVDSLSGIICSIV